MIGYRRVIVLFTSHRAISLGSLLVIPFAIALTAAADIASAQTSVPAGRERTGQELFQSGCAACHGANGRGGVRDTAV